MTDGKTAFDTDRKKRWVTLAALHALLLVYSTSTIFSKLAAGEEFLSFRFILYYGAIILLLGIYAIGWQQIIKRLPLTTAFANKAITVVWGLVWGLLFFGETLTWKKGIGVALVVLGVVLFATDKEAAQ